MRDYTNEEQNRLHETEPMHYQIVRPKNFSRHVFGDTPREVGFCVNSQAGGYTDSKMVWIADDVEDPVKFIEFCIHEGLHACLPELTEAQVEKSAEQIADFIGRALKAKGVKLRPIRPMVTAEEKAKLFPAAEGR